VDHPWLAFFSASSICDGRQWDVDVGGALGVLIAAALSDFIPAVLLHDGLLLPFFGSWSRDGRPRGSLARQPIVWLLRADDGPQAITPYQDAPKTSFHDLKPRDSQLA